VEEKEMEVKVLEEKEVEMQKEILEAWEKKIKE
jgi:hypothetical protein